MGDKSPKAKQRDKNQKNVAKEQHKSAQATKQASQGSPLGKDKKK
jgi:hypothetical protein